MTVLCIIFNNIKAQLLIIMMLYFLYPSLKFLSTSYFSIISTIVNGKINILMLHF